ncbi:MAG: M24 family metallopeptidase [Actinomycetota bacterium]
MDHGLRRKRLAGRLVDLEVDALFVTRLPNVRYLTGFTGSNAQALVTADATVLLTDGRYEEQSRREVPDAERVIYLDGVPPVQEQAAASSLARLGFEREGVTFGAWERLRGRLEGVELVPVGGEVERLRAAKDPEEVELVAAAQEAADVAFERVALGGGLREGVTEREVAFALEVEMRRAGADDKGFWTIVAFGEQAAEPHHEPSARTLRRGDVVKLDFGAIAGGYHSDMTRTVAFGEPDGRLREVRDLVAQAQRAGIDAVRAGALVADVDRAARSVIEAAGLGAEFPHGLGHGVGLEIHEDPRLHWDGTAAVPEGAVVTIEPGVYIPGLGGVRIEDMVVVTADGCRPIPRSTKELVVL